MSENRIFKQVSIDANSRNSFIGARMLAVELAPYLASAIFRLLPVSVHKLDTVAVDRWWRMYIDFEVFNLWNVYERALAIIHEVSHLIRDHSQRCEDLNAIPSAFNIAADAEINDDLNSFAAFIIAGEVFQGVPDHWILPARLHPPAEDGKLAEYYYKHIVLEQNSLDTNDTESTLHYEEESDLESNNVFNTDHCKNKDCGSGVGGGKRVWELEDDDTSFEKVDKITAKLIRRQVAHDVFLHQKSQGFVPNGILHWAVKFSEQPQIHWKKILAGKIKRAISFKAGQVDYSYQRPGRRRIPLIISPAMRKPIPSIAVILDTSASMSSKDLSAALTEIQGVSRQVGVRGKNLRLIQVDTNVCQIKDINDVKKIECHGGGGTDLRVGFRAIKTLKPSPNIIIVLTDGYTPWPESTLDEAVIIGLISESEPSVDVLDSIPSWANTVHIISDRE